MAQGIHGMGEAWRRAGLMQRVLLMGVLLGCVGGGVLLVNWARRPNLALLYAGLPPEEGAAVVEKIRDQGIAYELRAGGTAVYVPEEKVYSLRLSLAGATSGGSGSGGGHAGYKLLNDQSFGASPFHERVRYTQAVEGEIAKSIETLDAVAGARVHIVRPESSMFNRADKQPSATVVVRMKGAMRLSPSNVSAIVHMVSGCVEGLSPEKVVVVDHRGTLLTNEGTGDKNMAAASSVLEQKRQAEEYLANKAEMQLAQVLGGGRSTVQVSVVMDTTSTESETKRVGPDKGMPIRETVKEKKSVESPKEGAGAGTMTDSTTDTEYEITRTMERKTESAGGIKNKAVSVVVDLSPAKGADANAPRKLLAVKDVEEIVTTALGLNTEKGDKLVVKEASFYKAPEVGAVAAEDGGLLNKEFLLEVAKRSSLGLLVLGALLALRMFRPKARAAGAEAGAAGLPAGAGALALAGGGGGNLLPASVEANPDVLRAQITRALQDNPDEVKRLFLTWIESEKEESR